MGILSFYKFHALLLLNLGVFNGYPLYALVYDREVIHMFSDIFSTEEHLSLWKIILSILRNSC